MDKHQQGKIMLRHSLCWGWAILTPTVVMVVLDVFDKHTPNNIALFSSMCIMMPFIVCTKFVSQGLASVTQNEKAA